jgi:competence protein ComEC
MIVSHNDSDHSGGALSILKQMPVGLVLSSLNSDSAIVAESRQHRRCQSGQVWRWDGILFEILQPVAASYDSTKWKPNARSCVLKVSTSHYAMLLPGDIEAVQEDELVNSIPDKLRANVLLAPHHGSGTSSTPAFLQAVQPELAIFQLGYLNRYHHPKTEVWNRYADFGIKRLRTDESGCNHITIRYIIAVFSIQTGACALLVRTIMQYSLWWKKPLSQSFILFMGIVSLPVLTGFS